MYLDTVVCVFLQDFLGIFIRVEGVHKDQRNVCVVGFVQVLRENSRMTITDIVEFCPTSAAAAHKNRKGLLNVDVDIANTCRWSH